MSLLTDKIELNIQEAELGTKKTLLGIPPFFRWFIIVALLAIIPSYFIAKSISHKIWTARYSQGAITAKPSFTNPKAPTISKVTVTTQGERQYAALVRINNENLDLSLDQVPFEFIFSNSQKQQVYSYSEKLFLLPNQTKYITVPTFNTNDAIAFADFKISDKLPWQKKLQIPKVELLTSLPNTSYQNLPPAFVVQGDFYNNSPYTLSKVRLTFVLFDTAGNIIGIGQRDDFAVKPFERRGYKQLWPNMFAANLGRVDVSADTDPLDPNNLTITTGQAGSASDLSRPSANK